MKSHHFHCHPEWEKTLGLKGEYIVDVQYINSFKTWRYVDAPNDYHQHIIVPENEFWPIMRLSQMID